MSHMLARNPFVDSFGIDYESPFSRGMLHHSPMARRINDNSYLPRWLNFKSSKNSTQQNQSTDVQSSSNIIEKEQTESFKTNKDSQKNIYPSRILKASTSSKGLHRKVEEHEMETKTEEWKKIRKYERVRERRKLRSKQMNRKLRIVRRFYMPTAIFVVLGIVIIFCATIQSLGEGTMFWSHRETFNIVGTVLTLLGIIMLFVTVAFESQTSQKMKRENIFETDPFIHPDFLNEPNRMSRQISYQSSTCSSI